MPVVRAPFLDDASHVKALSRVWTNSLSFFDYFSIVIFFLNLLSYINFFHQKLAVFMMWERILYSILKHINRHDQNNSFLSLLNTVYTITAEYLRSLEKYVFIFSSVHFNYVEIECICIHVFESCSFHHLSRLVFSSFCSLISLESCN